MNPALTEVYLAIAQDAAELTPVVQQRVAEAAARAGKAGVPLMQALARRANLTGSARDLVAGCAAAAVRAAYLGRADLDAAAVSALVGTDRRAAVLKAAAGAAGAGLDLLERLAGDGRLGLLDAVLRRPDLTTATRTGMLAAAFRSGRHQPGDLQLALLETVKGSGDDIADDLLDLLDGQACLRLIAAGGVPARRAGLVRLLHIAAAALACGDLDTAAACGWLDRILHAPGSPWAHAAAAELEFLDALRSRPSFADAAHGRIRVLDAVGVFDREDRELLERVARIREAMLDDAETVTTLTGHLGRLGSRTTGVMPDRAVLAALSRNRILGVDALTEVRELIAAEAAARLALTIAERQPLPSELLVDVFLHTGVGDWVPLLEQTPDDVVADAVRAAARQSFAHSENAVRTRLRVERLAPLLAVASTRDVLLGALNVDQLGLLLDTVGNEPQLRSAAVTGVLELLETGLHGDEAWDAFAALAPGFAGGIADVVAAASKL